MQDLDSPVPSAAPAPADQGETDQEKPREAAVQPPQKQDEKAHWKLRALANIRRHSDSEIFISHAHKRCWC